MLFGARIKSAMGTCLEGYAQEVIKSIEYEIERELTSDEVESTQKAVYSHYEKFIGSLLIDHDKDLVVSHQCQSQNTKLN